MYRALQIIALVLVAIAMALSHALALELPGKMRLSKDAYLAAQKNTIRASRSAAWPSPRQS